MRTLDRLATHAFRVPYYFDEGRPRAAPDGECAGISAAIHRLLAQALAALAGTGEAQTEPAAWEAGAA